MSVFEDTDIFASYPLEQAVADGVLVELLKHRWPELTGGKPIVATAHLFSEVSIAGLMEIWNEFVQWKKTDEPTLAEEERLFKTSMNFKIVWVVEDDAAFTLMYPEDY
jgi:hypothetical protein